MVALLKLVFLAAFSVFVLFLLAFLVQFSLSLRWFFTVVMYELGFDNALIGTLSMRTIFACPVFYRRKTRWVFMTETWIFCQLQPATDSTLIFIQTHRRTYLIYHTYVVVEFNVMFL